jgi:hypothetical protein
VRAGRARPDDWPSVAVAFAQQLGKVTCGLAATRFQPVVLVCQVTGRIESFTARVGGDRFSGNAGAKRGTIRIMPALTTTWEGPSAIFESSAFMAPRPFEFWFGVGKPDGHHSMVWKVWGARNTADFYIAARAMGGRMKTSIHASGGQRTGIGPLASARRSMRSSSEPLSHSTAADQ